MTYIFLHFTSVCFVWKSFSTFFTRIRKRFLEFILSVHELLLDNNWNKVLSYKQPQQQQLLLPTVNMIVVSALDELDFGLLQFGEIVGKKFISIEFFLVITGMDTTFWSNDGEWWRRRRFGIGLFWCNITAAIISTNEIKIKF